MHLFITQPEVTQGTITISEERIVHHAGRVLRMRAGDFCLVQYEQGEKIYRAEVLLEKVTKQHLLGTVKGCKSVVKKQSKVGLLVALPNSAQKLSLIVQKLTEVGVDEIVFWKSERSQMKELHDKKVEKLQSIALESSEQSKRRSVPIINFETDMERWVMDKKLVMLEMDGESVNDFTVLVEGIIWGVVGPEGHFGDHDYTLLRPHVIAELCLGETILRMETASIIGAWALITTTK